MTLKCSRQELPDMAAKLRAHVIRMIAEAGSGHPGGSLSATEIVTSLYFHVMNYDPKKPNMPDRDRFIMSKGHACPVLYAAMAEAGFFPTEDLLTLRKLGSPLQGHPDKVRLPGLEASTGSLGQGLSIGIGAAMAARLDGKDYKTYVLLGDGEIDEGQIWEAAMAAVHFKASNLIAFLDANQQQLDGWTKEIMNLEPLADKWVSFGWHVQDIDGHDFDQILKAIEQAEGEKTKPSMILCRTVKGKGVSFMEGEVGFHGKAPTDEEAKQALAEIEKR